MTRRASTVAAPVLAALCLLAGLVAAGADANHSAPARVSVGTVNGNGAFTSVFDGATADGTKAWFHTDEQIATADVDDNNDIYERAGGVTTQLSITPTAGNGDDFSVQWKGASEDGSRVFMTTDEALVPSDTDQGCIDQNGETRTCSDIYEYSGGTVTQLSLGPNGGNGSFPSSYRGASADGSRVFFRTSEQMVASDTDSQRDIYQRSGGTTTQISTGPSGGNGAFEPIYRGASKDGTHVFFETEESLVAADTDSSPDLYDRSGGTTTLISTGPAGGNGAFPASFRGISTDGSHVFFETDESLVAADTDSTTDVYERSGGTTTLVSAGAGSGESLFEAASEGGTRVFFSTTNQLTGADTDSRRDLYERSGGTTTLVSAGQIGGNDPNDVIFDGISADGAVAVFSTTESLVSADTDGRLDVYQRAGGSTSFVSTGSGSINGAYDVSYRDISSDGARVIFETPEQLETSDTDLFPDVYERYNGVTTRLSTGASGGNAGQFAAFIGASVDATRVFLLTGEQLDSSDTDSQTDVYQAAVTTGYARPKAATPFDISLVPSFQVCASPNRTHGAPTFSGGPPSPSCAPPAAETSRLQVGTPDVNGQAAKSVSRLKFRTINGNPATPADDADIAITADINDVYTVPSPNVHPPDYTGELSVRLGLQLTDKSNGSVPQDPGTVTQIVAGFTVPCVATPDTTAGASCVLTTTADTLLPGTVKEGARTMWQQSQIYVTDGGADNQALTDPNSVFMRQGIFVP